jgi:polyisoprenoid-binding protein YceI
MTMTSTEIPTRIPETLASTPSPAGISGDYVLDPAHTRIGFSARHAMVTKVRGAFHDFEGIAYVDADNPADSSVHVTIHSASLTTGNDQRDGHLRSADFFDVAA